MIVRIKVTKANNSIRFIEGGDLQGIVSIKIPDISKKSQVEAAYVSVTSPAQPPNSDNEFIVSKVPLIAAAAMSLH